MNSKILFFIAFIAVFAGLFGVANNYLAKPPPATATSTPVIAEKPTVTYTVWRAKHTLNKGQAISASDVTRELMSEKEAHSNGINKDITLDFNSTTLLNTAIKSGDLVLPENQITPKQAGYLTLITREGMTLYPLTINTNNLIDNYIQPGDFIDIMAISSPETNLASATTRINSFSKVQANLFMQHVHVLSIQNSNSAIDPEVSTAKAAQITIVIEVHPDDLAKLALAQRTMYLEIYRSQQYRRTPNIQINDVIRGYNGVTELRG
ncbi:Flp pilus assembly protein CpaB [Photobacterium leiognathi]|uniref:Flp pilus assembly protein CpaB n=1 Tax=Photobacterium leiognathi TaxID=553611 RepID=UPI002981CD71|nr:Flp pilus assembly protein CpaB [Photobacterium leiognathi]